MGFFGDMGCKVGIHNWSDWYYEKPSACTQIKKCTRCGKINDEKRTEHQLGAWSYPTEGSCHNVRTCSRCGHTETRTLHPEVAWSYDRDADCSQHRTCPRCGEVQHRTEHVWDSWHYEGPKTCDQLRICARCHHRETRPARKDEDHAQWSDWDYATQYECSRVERHCLRCGYQKTDVRIPKHQYTDWKRTSRTRIERECIRCHHRDWESVDPNKP